MPIRVTCPGCHTRFNVSEQHAGKEGPCPKCKKKIRIPDATEEVVIHAPEPEGGKDSTGRPNLKPLERKQTVLSVVEITIIAALVIGFLVAAVIMRFMITDKSDFGWPLLAISAILIAPPVVFGCYTFLRDQELGSFIGKELWGRVAICSALYALLWFAMNISYIAFGDKYDMGSWSCAIGAMLAAGGAIGMLVMDFDYLLGLVHYGMYLGVCLLARLLAGIGVLPGMLNRETIDPNAPAMPAGAMLDWMSNAAMVDLISPLTGVIQNLLSLV